MNRMTNRNVVTGELKERWHNKIRVKEDYTKRRRKRERNIFDTEDTSSLFFRNSGITLPTWRRKQNIFQVLTSLLGSENGVAFPEKCWYNILTMTLETASSSEILVSRIRTWRWRRHVRQKYLSSNFVPENQGFIFLRNNYIHLRV
jgi:hypothetical protein